MGKVFVQAANTDDDADARVMTLIPWTSRLSKICLKYET